MDQITLKDFRCFREKQTARLAPLTLLVGENSTGKTSFMAMIRALWDVAYRQRIPDFKEEPYDLGSFDEIAHHRGARGSRADTFEAGFAVARKSRKGMAGGSYQFDVSFGKKGTVPVPVRRRLCNKKKNVWIEYGLQEDRTRKIRFGTPNGTWVSNQDSSSGIPTGDDNDLFPFHFLVHILRNESISIGNDREHDLIPLHGAGLPDDKDWRLVSQIVESGPAPRFLHNRFHAHRPYASAPVRSKPHRTYDPSSPAWDPEGDYVPMYLANIHFQDQVRWKGFKNALESFGKEAGLYDEISVRPLGKKGSEPFQIQIRKFGNRSKGPPRNLIDVGYGVSQVLPIITELLRDDAPPMLLMQQPEVHLHPSAQAALGSLFCQIAGPGRKLVVETHSDHLLDRVRMDVRDGVSNLKPRDVSILFFERRDLDVNIHSLRLDQEGNVLEAPPGYRQFFMDETRRSLGL